MCCNSFLWKLGARCGDSHALALCVFHNRALWPTAAARNASENVRKSTPFRIKTLPISTRLSRCEAQAWSPEACFAFKYLLCLHLLAIRRRGWPGIRARLTSRGREEATQISPPPLASEFDSSVRGAWRIKEMRAPAIYLRSGFALNAEFPPDLKHWRRQPGAEPLPSHGIIGDASHHTARGTWLLWGF